MHLDIDSTSTIILIDKDGNYIDTVDGDVLKIKDVEGKVVEVGIKTTKLRDVNTNDFFK